MVQSQKGFILLTVEVTTVLQGSESVKGSGNSKTENILIVGSQMLHQFCLSSYFNISVKQKFLPFSNCRVTFSNLKKVTLLLVKG
jgi:hypothetical protein